MKSLILITIVLVSCKKPVDDSTIDLPSNLTTTISTVEGLVTVEANANATNFYTITFYDGSTAHPVESNDGSATYTFSSSGTYTIITKAHATYTDFIEKTETVNVAITPIGAGGIPTSGYSTPLSYPGYTLVWNDEFTGTSLSADWIQEIGTGSSGWGNNELEYYRSENTTVGEGVLTITAKEENYNGQNYTSSRIKTQGVRSFKYGRIDIRAALPYGKGLWPALWMLGDNITSVGWPACGEIDIMELVGGGTVNDRTVYGTIHWDDSGNHASYGGSKSLSTGTFADEFHVFSITWDASSINFLLDDVVYRTANLTPPELSEFHENFFFIFNVAVGGNWPGSPDGTTIFPQNMYVDYVRVFQ